MESVLNKYLAKYDLLARETGGDNLKKFLKIVNLRIYSI